MKDVRKVVLTDQGIISAYRMISMGETWEQVAKTLYPNSDLSESTIDHIRESVHSWYVRQTPETLMVLAGTR